MNLHLILKVAFLGWSLLMQHIAPDDRDHAVGLFASVRVLLSAPAKALQRFLLASPPPREVPSVSFSQSSSCTGAGTPTVPIPIEFILGAHHAWVQSAIAVSACVALAVGSGLLVVTAKLLLLHTYLLIPICHPQPVEASWSLEYLGLAESQQQRSTVTLHELYDHCMQCENDQLLLGKTGAWATVVDPILAPAKDKEVARMVPSLDDERDGYESCDETTSRTAGQDKTKASIDTVRLCSDAAERKDPYNTGSAEHGMNEVMEHHQLLNQTRVAMIDIPEGKRELCDIIARAGTSESEQEDTELSATLVNSLSDSFFSPKQVHSINLGTHRQITSGVSDDVASHEQTIYIGDEQIVNLKTSEERHGISGNKRPPLSYTGTKSVYARWRLERGVHLIEEKKASKFALDYEDIWDHEVKSLKKELARVKKEAWQWNMSEIRSRYSRLPGRPKAIEKITPDWSGVHSSQASSLGSDLGFHLSRFSNDMVLCNAGGDDNQSLLLMPFVLRGDELGASDSDETLSMPASLSSVSITSAETCMTLRAATPLNIPSTSTILSRHQPLRFRTITSLAVSMNTFYGAPGWPFLCTGDFWTTLALK